ncbi:MAG: hypothetical protein M5U34_08335 [Chloroflexi bacterium]|nr:hypothetical protein [Chloroflexota bacterium]
MQDTEGDKAANPEPFGLVKRDGSRRPAFDTYRVAITRLADAAFVERGALGRRRPVPRVPARADHHRALCPPAPAADGAGSGHGRPRSTGRYVGPAPGRPVGQRRLFSPLTCPPPCAANPLAITA